VDFASKHLQKMDKDFPKELAMPILNNNGNILQKMVVMSLEAETILSSTIPDQVKKTEIPSLDIHNTTVQIKSGHMKLFMQIHTLSKTLVVENVWITLEKSVQDNCIIFGTVAKEIKINGSALEPLLMLQFLQLVHNT